MYIRHPIRKTLSVFAVLAVFGAGIYGALWLDERDQRKSQAESNARARVQTLAETSAQLQKAVENYRKKREQDGEPLPAGEEISLADLEKSEILNEKDLNAKIEIETFAFKILPEDAPEQSLKMVMVTNQGRATVDKKGRGALYEK